MGTETKIQWTDHTFNPWRGCSEVHAGCDNCYARTLAKRNPGVLGVWGPAGTRVVASEAHWRLPLKWNREAQAAGVRKRVFCASLADVFEAWDGPMMRSGIQLECQISGIPVTMGRVRQRLFELIDATPWIDWQLVTKRPENVQRMWPTVSAQLMGRNVNAIPRGRHGSYRDNVWLLTSISDQQTADAMIPRLRECRELCPVLGLSAEPLLGPVDLRFWSPKDPKTEGEWMAAVEGVGVIGKNRPVDWVIIGGESGPNARPCNVEWIRSLVAQCREAGVPAFVKQLGARPFDSGASLGDDECVDSMVARQHDSIRDPKGGEPSEWPADLRVREFPRMKGGKP